MYQYQSLNRRFWISREAASAQVPKTEVPAFLLQSTSLQNLCWNDKRHQETSRDKIMYRKPGVKIEMNKIE